MKRQEPLKCVSRRGAWWVGLISLVAVFSSQATTWYWNGNISQDWANPNNFQSSGLNEPGVPAPYDTVNLEAWAVREPLINNSNHAPILDIYLSKSLTVVTGGVLEAVYFKVGQNASATLMVTGGFLSADNHLDVGGYNGGTATVNVSGGVLLVGGLNLNLNGAATGASYLNLTGGSITAQGNLSINSTHPAVVNLAGGTLVVPASNLGNVTYWINNGNIKGYGGAGTVTVDDATSPGNLILTGAPALTWYWNGNTSQDWSEPNNFQSSGGNLPDVPAAGSTVWLEPWAVRAPLINNGNHAPLNVVYQNKNLTVAAGGQLATTFFKVGQGASATLTVTGGALAATNHLDVGGYAGGTASLNVSGGTITVGGFHLNLDGDAASVGGSQVYLSGGTIVDTGSISINEAHPTLLNFAGGALTVPTSQQANVNFWIGDGSIASYGIGGTTNDFHFDLTSLPGSLVITAKYSGFVADSFPQWNPQTFTNLPSLLDQAMPLVPAGLEILAEADFGFGTAVATNGEVYFTEAAAQRIRKYHPSNGTVTTVVAGRPGVYGIATDTAGNLFYALDSDGGTGRVVRRNSGGAEQDIITNLTRPRQLATDGAGNVYVVLEADRKILKWDKNSSTVSTLLDQHQLPATPQGVAVAANGRVFFSAYGRTGGAGTMLTQGTVWVRETNGVIQLLAAGLARARGVALHPNGELYVATEANPWDNGNSGLLVKIATNGVVTRVVTGVDYPQFPAFGADGKLYVTSARDNKLLAFDPAHNFAAQTIAEPGVALVAAGATWQETAGGNYPIQLHLTNNANPADALTLAGFLQVSPNAGEVGLWFNVPVTNFNISLAQIPNGAGNPNSGMFLLPAATVDWAYGPARVSVIPLRQHQRCRWPMSNVGNAALEAPAPDFAEAPVSYLVYVSVGLPPALNIQSWPGNQVRIAWPISATGYTLQRSATAPSGYANPGLTVTVEGSENVVYDGAGASARFYRLIK